ncbi:MAG: glycosyltransferase family 2 protein [Candidatus Dormiibacterota bacterium]|jgi:glycosyltransferase involved in cell wall biosynthesis
MDAGLGLAAGSARTLGDGHASIQIEMLVPDCDTVDPELSIVIPACDEALTVGDFVDWCLDGIGKSGVSGEIMIVDSSTDATAPIALAHGARVLRVPRRGLGQAYIDAIPYIRGRFVLMGDADCTYDFRDLSGFVRGFHDGYDFVMGSRWKGTIEAGSMPWHHRYIGTPLTTWILNLLYGSHFSDIHCGMRGITRDALVRMGLQSTSWEYASEIVLKSVHMGLRTTEVPVGFLRDRDGRLSHHKRLGWTSPFQAAWVNLRAMFVYGAEFFVYWPGIVTFVLGLLITLLLCAGPITLGPLHLSLYAMLIGMTLCLTGLQLFFFGCLAQVLHDYTGRARRRWLTIFPYTRTVLLCACGFVLGATLVGRLVAQWLSQGLALRVDQLLYNAVMGLMVIMLSFTTFGFTLLLHAAALRATSIYGRRE